MSCNRSRLLAALILAPFATFAISQIVLADTPEVGTKSTYRCDGPYSKLRQYELVEVQGDVLRWLIKVDGKPQWVEKPMRYRGLSLFSKRDRNDGKGQRQQSINAADFADYESLKPGATFSGKVGESHNKGSWTWNYYSIVVGKREQISHDIVGPVEVTTVTERRKVVGGDYQSELVATLGVKPQVNLGWQYKDRKGTETCELESLTRP